MPTPQELEAKFWKAPDKDRTVMLGLDGVEDGHTRPMTAQVEGESGPIWFFAGRDNGFVQALRAEDRAILSFASKGHDLFATVHGSISIDNDHATIDRLWNSFVAAWYEGGKEDPNLVLLRLDAEEAQIWLNENSLFGGVRMLPGIDPRKDYEDKVATVELD